MTDKNFFMPVSGIDLPRFAGVPTFMRLPHVTKDDAEYSQVEMGLIGIPWDTGTTNRPGTRHGPRQLRDMSTMIRMVNAATGVNPFETVNCADLGDVPPNPIDVMNGMERITNFYSQVKANNIIPMTAGGDHLLSLPVLRAMAADRPVGLIQFDSHTDLLDSYFDGNKFTHGTPFRRAIEEGLVDPKRFVQVGIRGTAYNFDDVNGRRTGRSDYPN